MTAVTFPLRPPRLAFAICGWRWQIHVHEIKYSVVYSGLLNSPKSLSSFLVSIKVMLKHCGVTLSKTIDIKDSAQVIKLIMTCKIHSFPD